MSAILKLMADSSLQRLLATSSDRDKTRVLSAGGPNAGKSLIAPAGLKSSHSSDEEFTEIIQWRVGVPPQLEPTLCQNTTAAGQVCDEVMTQHCDHAMCCRNGPLRIRRHDDVADCLADIINETGAHVRREAYIKTFSTERSDAWLDIWAFGGLQVPELIVDITI